MAEAESSSHLGFRERWITTVLLGIGFIAEGFIVAPNNLTALCTLPESQVMMAAGLMGLMRSVSNVMGVSSVAILLDMRWYGVVRLLLKFPPRPSP